MKGLVCLLAETLLQLQKELHVELYWLMLLSVKLRGILSFVGQKVDQKALQNLSTYL